MTPKERMMRALRREKPDRLPVTIHQWQQWHLDNYMGGMDALSAFKAVGLHASIQYFEAMGQFWIPNAEKYIVQTPQWRDEIKVVDSVSAADHFFDTPVENLVAFAEAAKECSY
jgi:uroporphyrinogen decarboxylase